MSAAGQRQAETGTPYALLWLTAIVGGVLAIAAFILWGTGGGGLLLDLVAALCS